MRSFLEERTGPGPEDLPVAVAELPSRYREPYSPLSTNHVHLAIPKGVARLLY
jgi:hypothetical protein